MVRNSLLLLFALSLSFAGFSQRGKNPYTTKNKKAIAAYQASENYLVRRQYGQVIQLMQDALNRDDKFVEARIRLANVYKVLGQHGQAIQQFEKASQLQGAPSELQFTLGESYWQIGEYGKAETAITTYLNAQARSKPMQEAANHILKSVAFAKEAMADPSTINPEPLADPLNKFPLQYFPVITADGSAIIYTRREGVSPADDEDIMVSYRENGSWQAPVSLSDSINSKYNEGTCTISADGRTIIFTSCQGRRSYGSCDLFVSYKTGDSWSKPRNLGANINSRYWESQASLSADGRTLYFVSDRPGGVGKTDIYVAYRDNEGNWQEAQNIGREINTRGDEVSPFIHANGVSLYFSSNGHVGMGGYDLFLIEKNGQSWKEPKNLGYPINTHEDQVSLYVNAEGDKAYYSIEQMQEGRLISSVLNAFEIPQQARVSAATIFVKGKVIDAVTGKPIGAEVSLFTLNSDSLLSKVRADAISGQYLMVLPKGNRYGLYAEEQGYLYKSLSFSLDSTEQASQVIDIALSPIKKGAATQLSNVFFDTDKYELRSESKTELLQVARMLKENPKVTIEISGHTDNIGNADYNKVLSKNRAQAVKTYLKLQGIEAQRMQAVGYGASRPVSENSTEIGRQNNRRIEIEIK